MCVCVCVLSETEPQVLSTLGNCYHLAHIQSHIFPDRPSWTYHSVICVLISSEKNSDQVAQIGRALQLLLTQPLKCWDHRSVPSKSGLMGFVVVITVFFPGAGGFQFIVPCYF